MTLSGHQHEWSLRPASVTDAAVIARFLVACWKDAFNGIVPEEVLDGLDVAERTDRWRRRLVAGRRSTAVAELVAPPRPIAGVASWGPSHDAPEPSLPALELASLYVAREHWGRGIAAALLQHAVRATPVHLWVFEANARARAFYEKHGFVADGRAKVDEETGVLECRYVRG